MRTLSISFVMTLAALTLAAPTLGQAQARPAAFPFLRPDRLEPAPTENAREIIVVFRDGTEPIPAVPFAVRGEPVFPRDPGTLRAERMRAEERSGRSLPDLTLFWRLHLRETVEPAAALASLLARSDVETAHFAALPAPSPTDLAPPTGDFTPRQRTTFQAPAPTGVNALYAWTLPGGRGHGIRLCDIEYNWFQAHEELNDVRVTFIGPQHAVPPGLNFLNETFHGTASLGVVGADRNGYGVEGIASRAHLMATGQFTVSGGYSPAAAINRAASVLRPGDVMLLELQMFGGFSGTSLVPAEWHTAEFAAITNAVAAGIIVVEAAGNGGLDLSDTNEFGMAFHRSFRDSGAFLVAGGDGQRRPINVTNHCTIDSRIDLFALGAGVRTTGYGDLFYPGSDNLQSYTDTFAGTSSASAIVAGCAASLQGILSRVEGSVLPPGALRSLLVTTGTPQASDPRLIGTQPDLRAAVASHVESFAFLLPFGLAPGTPSGNPLTPNAVKTADLNHDGFLDLVVSYQDGLTQNGFLEIALGLGGGGFAPVSGPILVGFGLPWLEIADFNGDGDPDIAGTASTQVQVFLGDGFGGILASTITPLASAGSGLDATDFDADGNTDIAVAQGSLLSVLAGDGRGNFTVTQNAFAGKTWTDVRAGDMNGDGAIDFCLIGGSIDVLTNDGSGNPTLVTTVAAAAGGLDLGDVNHDGTLDAVVLRPAAGTLEAYAGDGAGGLSLASTHAFASPLQGVDVRLYDMNADHVLDAVAAGVSTTAGTGPGVLPGDGRGGFLPPSSGPSIGFLYGHVAAGDLDGIPGGEVAIATTGPPSVDVEIFTNPALGAGMHCRAGNVNAPAGCGATDVLFVNGLAGDVDRVVRIPAMTPLTVTVNDPPAGPSQAPFALFAVRGPVGFSDAAVQPFGIGTACFPTHLSGSGLLPNTYLLLDTLGPASPVTLPAPRFVANATRSIRVNGLGVGTRVTLQGVTQDLGRAAPLSVTNVVYLESW